jgi:ribosome-binding protein aMBF1 (putative translation factor)
LQEFGRSVKRARVQNGWKLDDLARQITPAPGTSFLFHLEQAKRAISPATAGKLIKALSLPDHWTHHFLDADITPESEETPADRDTDLLLRLHAQDPAARTSADRILRAKAVMDRLS